MTTTFASRLTGAGGRNLRLYFTIAGVPFLFQEDETTVPAAVQSDVASRTVLRTIEKIEIAEKRLDMRELRMVGGSMVITLLDDSAGSLASLFAVRSRRTTYLNANETAASTTINVADVASLASAGAVYVDGETISYTSTTGGGTPTLNGATRGAFGSEAQVHFGDTESGAGVYRAPPAWKGRRVTLRGYFLNSVAGTSTSTSALSETIDTFRLEEAPVFVGEGRWELRCSHLSDEFITRKLGTGLREVSCTGRVGLTSSNLQYFRTDDDGGIDQFNVAGGILTYVRLETDETPMIFQLTQTVGDPTTPDVEFTGNDLVSRGPGDAVSLDVKSARNIVILSGDAPGTQALYAITSRTGNGANGAYDQLPGATRTVFGGEEWRFGAGVLAAEVDVSAFLDVGSSPIPGWSYVIDGEVTLADFLRDFCLVTGCFWFVNNVGQISVKRLAEARTSSTFTFDTSTLVVGGANGLEPSITYDESSIYPRIELTCNYDPASRDFRGTLSLVDVELAGRYPTDDNILRMQTRSLCFNEARMRPAIAGGTLLRPTATRLQVQSILRRIQVGGGRGDAVLVCRATVDALVVDLGDIVTFTDSIPDLEGAASIAARTCRVLAIAPDFEHGVVDFTLQILETLFHVAPACTISSTGGGGTILLLNGSDVASPDASPGNMFAANWIVRIFDISAGTFVDRTVSSAGATSVILTAALGFVVEADVDFITIAPQANNLSTSLAASINGFRPLEFLYHQASTPTGAPVTRWR